MRHAINLPTKPNRRVYENGRDKIGNDKYGNFQHPDDGGEFNNVDNPRFTNSRLAKISFIILFVTIIGFVVWGHYKLKQEPLEFY